MSGLYFKEQMRYFSHMFQAAGLLISFKRDPLEVIDFLSSL